MAGGAHQALVHQIDLYEQAVTRNDADAQAKIMDTIDAIFDGREVKVGDQVIPANAVTGQVSAILADARQYRSSIVNQRLAELNTFRAKLTQFKTNPDVLVQREWTDAMASFLDHPYVEIFSMPPGIANELWLNRDPRIAKDYEKQRKEAELKKEQEKRLLEQAEERFKTRTDQTILKTR
jgi:hypothetical protein